MLVVRRPHFRLWILMAIVVVCALGFSVPGLRRRASNYRQKAEKWGLIEKAWHKNVERELRAQKHGYFVRRSDLKVIPLPPELEKQDRELLRFLQSREEKAAATRRKYERAARYPWLSVEPDRWPPDF
jgi:hypothetical protein